MLTLIKYVNTEIIRNDDSSDDLFENMEVTFFNATGDETLVHLVWIINI